MSAKNWKIAWWCWKTFQDLYRQTGTTLSEQKSNLTYKAESHGPPVNSQTRASLQNQNPLNEREPGPLEKRSHVFQ